MTRLRGLRVISGYGVSRLGAIATNNNYPAIAKRLGAKLLLDGTVLRLTTSIGGAYGQYLLLYLLFFVLVYLCHHQIELLQNIDWSNF